MNNQTSKQVEEWVESAEAAESASYMSAHASLQWMMLIFATYMFFLKL